MVKKKAKKIIVLAAGCMSAAFAAYSQDSATVKKVDMADALRASGKIYVVFAVLITILLGLIIYMIRLDKKIGRLEKENKS